MSKVEVTKARVVLTEQTVKELMEAIRKAKENTTFIDTPMPNGDMTEKDYWRLKRERGHIIVRSYYGDIEFHVDVETKPSTQESLGYVLAE